MASGATRIAFAIKKGCKASDKEREEQQHHHKATTTSPCLPLPLFNEEGKNSATPSFVVSARSAAAPAAAPRTAAVTAGGRAGTAAGVASAEAAAHRRDVAAAGEECGLGRKGGEGGTTAAAAFFRDSLEAEVEEQQQARKRGLLQSIRTNSVLQRKDLQQRQQALEEDATAFSYDEIFEEVSSTAAYSSSNSRRRGLAAPAAAGLLLQRQEPRIYLGYRPAALAAAANRGEAKHSQGEEAEAAVGAFSPAVTRRNEQQHLQQVHAREEAGEAGAPRTREQRQERVEEEQEEEKEKEEVKEKEESSTRLPASRFIEKLQQAAWRRQLEREIVQEKVLQRQQETDAQQQKTAPEVFVTAAYKRRLEERRQLAQQLEQQEARDSKHAAEKQENLFSFHAYLLRSGQGSRTAVLSVPAAPISQPQHRRTTENTQSQVSPKKEPKQQQQQEQKQQQHQKQQQEQKQQQQTSSSAAQSSSSSSSFCASAPVFPAPQAVLMSASDIAPSAARTAPVPAVRASAVCAVSAASLPSPLFAGALFPAGRRLSTAAADAAAAAEGSCKEAAAAGKEEDEEEEETGSRRRRKSVSFFHAKKRNASLFLAAANSAAEQPHSVAIPSSNGRHPNAFVSTSKEQRTEQVGEEEREPHGKRLLRSADANHGTTTPLDCASNVGAAPAPTASGRVISRLQPLYTQRETAAAETATCAEKATAAAGRSGAAEVAAAAALAAAGGAALAAGGTIGGAALAAGVAALAAGGGSELAREGPGAAAETARGGEAGEKHVEREEQCKTLDDLLHGRRRERQRQAEAAAQRLGEDKIEEARRRYLERKRRNS